MHLTFKQVVRLKLRTSILLFLTLCPPNAFAQSNAPFFLPGLSQENESQATPPAVQAPPTPLNLTPQTPESRPIVPPAFYQEETPSAQPLTTDSGLFLPFQESRPMDQYDFTQTPSDSFATDTQNTISHPQDNPSPLGDSTLTNTWQSQEPKAKAQEQKLYFTSGKDLIKEPAAIVLWKDITPPIANNQYQLLIDPASIVPSTEHPRWRQAIVQAKIKPDHYLQWKLTFSCKANAVRYDDMETVTEGVSVHENRQYIYFVPITDEPSQQWLRYAYNMACEE